MFFLSDVYFKVDFYFLFKKMMSMELPGEPRDVGKDRRKPRDVGKDRRKPRDVG